MGEQGSAASGAHGSAAWEGRPGAAARAGAAGGGLRPAVHSLAVVVTGQVDVAHGAVGLKHAAHVLGPLEGGTGREVGRGWVGGVPARVVVWGLGACAAHAQQRARPPGGTPRWGWRLQHRAGGQAIDRQHRHPCRRRRRRARSSATAAALHCSPGNAPAPAPRNPTRVHWLSTPRNAAGGRITARLVSTGRFLIRRDTPSGRSASRTRPPLSRRGLPRGGDRDRERSIATSRPWPGLVCEYGFCGFHRVQDSRDCIFTVGEGQKHALRPRGGHAGKSAVPYCRAALASPPSCSQGGRLHAAGLRTHWWLQVGWPPMRAQRERQHR
jgi:hypothetical protein